ncbi:MAG: hypothetical protein P9L92_04010 [Candidatus Electryonea clarkiae]|nr:hypothetical protein [Candidatus Electryonea clarkiae]MDP8286565.1 hypothetical protein [Candidatus Electryonea clarkiae]
MPNNTSDPKSGQVIIPVILIILILLPFGYSLVNRVIAQGSDRSEAFLERPDAKYENCIRDTEYMRYHHWELLRTVRVEVVRYGKRGDIRLDSCMECHPNRERFCNRCHEAVSLTPDCFGCHYYPEIFQPSSIESVTEKTELIPVPDTTVVDSILTK